MIWRREFTLDTISIARPTMQTLVSTLGIEFTEVGEDYLRATMPVDGRTCQPMGILHGGGSVALAETLGSVASWMVADPEMAIPVGLEVNANHVRPVAMVSQVSGTCKPLHLGSTTHVWEIRIENMEQKLVCISRLTVALRKLG